MTPAPKPKRRKTAKRKLAKADREHYARVVEIGCSICQMPAEIHHLLMHKGMGSKSSNRAVSPLCPDHHRRGEGDKLAIHAGVETWKDRYGTELDHLARVRELLA